MFDLPKIMLSIETSRGFGRDVLTGISDFTRIHNPWYATRKPPFFRRGQYQTKQIVKIPSDIVGIITRNIEEMPIIQKKNIPAIFATSLVPKGRFKGDYFPRITSDHEAIVQVAIDYFLSQGFKRLAYCGFPEVSWSQKRRQCFCDYAKEKGFEANYYQEPHGRHGWGDEIAAIADWMTRLPKHIAIMACCDDRAEDLIEAAKLADIKIPEEVAILGVDNDNLICNLSNPTLSSVVMNTVKVGYDVAELLYKLIKGQEKMCGQKLIVSPLHVEVRQSTDILAVDDHDIALALSFIREKAKDPIGVQDVVAATTLSRRVLESRFRKVLSRSILHEIRRVRLEIICRMLMETNRPIKTIAVSMGFTSVD